MGTKTALITGANSGLGLATAHALAQRSFDLILTCRSEEKGQQTRALVQKANPAVQIDLVTADLTDLKTVREAAAMIVAKHNRLDVLINNAGYAPATIEFTPEGIERSFFASHIGHFVLTYHLTDLMKQTAAQTGDARIVSLSSRAHGAGRRARFFRHIDTLTAMAAYGDDKLANLLFAKGAALQLAGSGITAYSVHPGVVQTNFGSDTSGFLGQMFRLARPLMRTPEKGAQTIVFLASAPLKTIGEKNNGAYFADSRPTDVSSRDVTEANARWLWERSLAYV